MAERIVARQVPDAAVIAEERKRKNYAEFWNVIPITEPYRCILSEMRDRLYHTRSVCLSICPLSVCRSPFATCCGHGPP
jgi:phosphoenolpyruvate carboxylase